MKSVVVGLQAENTHFAVELAVEDGKPKNERTADTVLYLLEIGPFRTQQSNQRLA
jgi:hypothetical protein